MASSRPKICILLGPKKYALEVPSGKTSILNVVLDDLEPNSTLYNEPTRIPWVKSFDAFLDFEMWDLPGGRYDVENLDNLDLQRVGACIFVIDAQAFQGDNTDQARRMAQAMFKMYDLNPKTTFEIFIHKVDGMSDTYRLDVQQDLRNRVNDELNDLVDMEGLDDYVFPPMSYHFTSIYQSSVYEALSKVISRLMPCQGALERLLDTLCTHSSFDKAYVFDLASKLYFATDSTPGDSATHELCTEYIDLHWEMDQIYSRELQDDGQDTISLPSQISNGAIQECARQKHPLKRQPVRSTFSGCVTLSNGITMAHWELSDEIALIARVGSIVIAQSSAAVEKNVEHFRDAVVQIRNLEATR
ncbi:MAG: hypothetical protein CYPHOPRED_003659 [Cyphobasidiales sp. Tagirdzhanova-0007]|nr:MAG: hypothetical protein CYPHOPRED_003659 [Cyphobasidiales sp. Tagirdzhanova-0007]